MKKYNSEAELAAALVECLERDDRNSVYEEVQIERGGPRADVAVLRDGCATVIETKLGPTTDGIVQAMKWRQDAHYVAVAVQWIADPERRGLCEEIFQKINVGLIFVGNHITTPVASKCNHTASSRLVDHLIEHGHEYQSGKFARAGTKDGGHVTPCNVTLQKLREYIEHNAGCHLKHAVSGINHHWPTDSIARNNLAKLLKQNAIPGVTFETEAGMTVLYPTTQGATK